MIIKPAVLERVKKAIVSIKLCISASAYNNVGSFEGTGFVVDKALGLIGIR